MRRIVYIRATDQRPLYIERKGKFYLITTFLVWTDDGQLVNSDPYFLRVGDVVRVRYVNPYDGRVYTPSVDIDIDSSFIDEPRIARQHPQYIFVA